MLRYRNLLVFGALSLSGGALVSTAFAADPPYVTAAVQNPARPPKQMALDADRKPADLMTFAGIKPGDKVADFAPEKSYDAYFTMVMSKIVGPQGKVYAFMPLRGFLSIQAMRTDEKKQREAGKTMPPDSLDATLAIQHTTDYRNVTSIKELLTMLGGDCDTPEMRSANCFSLPEQADAVFAGEGYHLLHNKAYGTVNNEPVDMVALNKSIFRGMRPGAVYVISDYAAAKGAGLTQTESLNRIEADAVKSEVVAAGFMFDGESNVLMNPSDDLSKPAEGDKASRFVLRFRKLASASPETKRYPLNIMANFFGNTVTFPGPGSRTWFYHPDGSYQEFGLNDMQIAHTYFDADGHECMYHEAPADQEGYVVCHHYGPPNINAKVGDTWTTPNGRAYTLLKGYHYPTPPPAGQK